MPHGEPNRVTCHESHHALAHKAAVVRHWTLLHTSTSDVSMMMSANRQLMSTCPHMPPHLVQLAGVGILFPLPGVQLPPPSATSDCLPVASVPIARGVRTRIWGILWRVEGFDLQRRGWEWVSSQNARSPCQVTPPRHRATSAHLDGCSGADVLALQAVHCASLAGGREMDGCMLVWICICVCECVGVHVHMDICTFIILSNCQLRCMHVKQSLWESMRVIARMHVYAHVFMDMSICVWKYAAFMCVYACIWVWSRVRAAVVCLTFTKPCSDFATLANSGAMVRQFSHSGT